MFGVSNAFVGGSLEFESASYEDMRIIFIERYGEPTDRSQKLLETRTGVKVMNETVSWLDDKVVIELSRYASTINKGSGDVFLKTEVDRMHREKAGKLHRGKDDL
jgi:hypothetical protein